jgi:anti-sigma regulatory factor (Ser/Thr protein kinase)
MGWNATCVRRAPWEHAFLAEPEELSAVRRVVRDRLARWGLHEVEDPAQLCVSELVNNVIAHVGPGTPVTLASSMSGTSLRYEVRDPDLRALPTLLRAAGDDESGRGLALVDVVAERWGVDLGADRKTVWCELATGLSGPGGHSGGTGVARAEVMLADYGSGRLPYLERVVGSHLDRAVMEESAVLLVSDVLRWLRAHGVDPDEVLELAQSRTEALANHVA